MSRVKRFELLNLPRCKHSCTLKSNGHYNNSVDSNKLTSNQPDKVTDHRLYKNHPENNVQYLKRCTVRRTFMWFTESIIFLLHHHHVNNGVQNHTKQNKSCGVCHCISLSFPYHWFSGSCTTRSEIREVFDDHSIVLQVPRRSTKRSETF